MLTKGTAKTKSVPSVDQWLNRRFSSMLIAGACIMVVTFVVGNYRATHRTLHVNGYAYHLEVADTDAEREKGLGDRRSMPADHGMLFVFDQAEKSCFWMKDTHFSLDIIWTDAAGTVVHMVKSLSPNTYPQDYCTPLPAKYVIELNAGQADARRIHDGDRLSF